MPVVVVYTSAMQDFDVIIIGGGAAGLMCAAQANARGRRVLVLTARPRSLKKFAFPAAGAPTSRTALPHRPIFCRTIRAFASRP